tara:strand:+ start:226 stop:462 length:237 start_codon:yes stop_codon:yes gene_type:complete
MSMQIKFDDNHIMTRTFTGVAGYNHKFKVTVMYDTSNKKVTVDNIQWEDLELLDICKTDWKQRAEKRISKIVKEWYEL